MRRKTHRVVLLFGPTAVGKTTLLQELPADRIEVISADSMQVYRGMDVGTAKPSLLFRKRIPHHLIDIRDPDEQFQVGDFVRCAESTISEIVSHGRVPVVSGGTAYYFKMLLFGLPTTPPSDPEARARIREQLSGEGLPALYERLRQIDPESAERVDSADSYRIARALEVFETTGRPLSAYPLPTTPRTDILFTTIGLDRPRHELYCRINQRVEAMFANGLIDEVASLVEAGYRANDPGMRGIGYREFFTEDGTFRRDEVEMVMERVKTDSRRYAKRQLTFFRNLPDTQWMNPGETRRISRLLAAANISSS